MAPSERDGDTVYDAGKQDMSAGALLKLVRYIGSDAVQVEDPRNGWPGILMVHGDPQMRLAVHVGQIGLSHRNRDDVERRFQNPGQNRPLSDAAGALPLLVGVWDEGAPQVIVAMDAARRMNRPTRQSLFIRLSELTNAQARGWSEYTSASGERIYLFHPALFETYVRLYSADRHASTGELQDLVAASGLIDPTTTPEDRLRRLSSVLVRRAAFAVEVLVAYGGLCAMCGLNLGLVEAAHIYPAHAAGSPDSVTNGLALCRNHHGAFDQHYVWVNPETSDVKLHPSWVIRARESSVVGAFVQSCLPKMRPPVNKGASPNPKFFHSRYEYFGGSYSWVEE